jgi:hypothetical protein
MKDIPLVNFLTAIYKHSNHQAETWVEDITTIPFPIR